MTIQDIRAQEQRQREIDYVEKIRRTIRSDYKIEDGVPMPPAWVWVALAVLVVGLAVWDGGDLVVNWLKPKDAIKLGAKKEDAVLVWVGCKHNEYAVVASWKEGGIKYPYGRYPYGWRTSRGTLIENVKYICFITRPSPTDQGEKK